VIWRLSLVAPEVLAGLTTIPEDRLRPIALETSEWAVEQADLSSPIVDAALSALREGRFGSSPERDALSALVDELDEIAWDIQDATELVDATESSYGKAFARSRAASAVLSALDADPFRAAADSLYETHAAVGDLRGLLVKLGHSLLSPDIREEPRT
jgi:hypothetical protein